MKEKLMRRTRKQLKKLIEKTAPPTVRIRTAGRTNRERNQQKRFSLRTFSILSSLSRIVFHSLLKCTLHGLNSPNLQEHSRNKPILSFLYFQLTKQILSILLSQSSRFALICFFC